MIACIMVSSVVTCQVRVQRPNSLSLWQAASLEDRRDRVVAAPARPEPIRFRLEPGFPLGFQCVTDPALVAAVRDDWNSERP